MLRIALRKGVVEGSRPWLVIGGLALAVRVLRLASTGRPERVFRAELAPGETLRIVSRRVD